jgi:hypothetical protein
MAIITGQAYLDPLEPEGDPGRNLSMQTALDDFMNNLSGADLAALERVALTVVEVTSATFGSDHNEPSEWLARRWKARDCQVGQEGMFGLLCLAW